MDEASMARLWSTPSHDGLDETRALAEAKRKILGRGAPIHLRRYRLGVRLGQGGGGTVYRAFDPVLKREVAIKVVVLRDDRRVELADCRRLVREAQVLAQLSHPNLVPIYDVGWLPQPQTGVFVVMERVNGGDLHEWLLTPRPWRQVLARFIAAAEGLAAAHERGIVHRDFKPANVLVDTDARGTDRVLVADFGLARPGPRDAASTGGASGDTLRSSDVVTGRDVVVGTPRYMPPEQHEGRSIDVRADVYTWCASVYEAVYGTPPFSGSSTAALHEAKRRGSIEPPVRREAPEALRRVLRRGLSADPDRRWPSMRALLRAISAAIDGGRVRRRTAFGLVAVVGVIGFIAAPQSEPCEARGLAVAERWSPAVQARVQEAFASTGAPFAHSSFVAGRDALARHVDALRGETVAACRAREIERIACALAAEAAVGEVVDAWLEADRATAQRARQTVDALPGARCGGGARLDSEPRDLAAILARVQARHALGHWNDGLDLVERTLARRNVADTGRARAELSVWRARFLAEAGRLEAAVVDARSGYFLAIDEDAPEVAVHAANTLVEIEGTMLARTDDGLAWGRHAMAQADRLGDPAWHGRVLDNLGEVHSLRGDDRRALELHEQALELLTGVHGPEGVPVAIALNRIGNARRNLGELDAAALAYERAHAIFAIAGEDHPRALMVLSNLGNVELDRGRAQAARERFEAATEGLRRALGPVHRSVGVAENGLANAMWNLGEHDDAVVHYRAARTIFEHALGSGHADTAAVRYNLASRLIELGRHESARAELRAAADAFQRLSPESAGLSAVLLAWGAMERDLGNASEAYDLLSRAVDLGRAAQQRPDTTADAEAVLAELALQLQRTDRARMHITRARAEYEATHDDAGVARLTTWAADHRL